MEEEEWEEEAVGSDRGFTEQEHAAGAVNEIYAQTLENSKDGLTCDELAEMLDCGQNQISGRFTELAKENLIYRTTERRKTRSGSTAFVWRKV